MGEKDPLKLESPYLHSSETMGLNRHPFVSDNYSPNSMRTLFSPVTEGSYYSPETVPISPCNSENNDQDILASCMQVAKLKGVIG